MHMVLLFSVLSGLSSVLSRSIWSFYPSYSYFYIISLALDPTYNCACAIEATLKDMGNIGWYLITAKHNKVWIMYTILEIYEYFGTRSRYLRQGYCGMQLLIPAWDTCFWCQSTHILYATGNRLNTLRPRQNSFYFANDFKFFFL